MRSLARYGLFAQLSLRIAHLSNLLGTGLLRVVLTLMDAWKMPANDITCINCSRCGCEPRAHALLEADDARERGNDAFAFGEFEKSILPYSEAIRLAAPGDARPWSNRAAAYLALGKWSEALHDASRACDIEPRWAKARARKATAEARLGKHAAAAGSWRAALKLEPGNETYQVGLADAEAAHVSAARRSSGSETSSAKAGVRERASALAARGEHAAAAALYKEAIHERPNDGMLRGNLSACLAHLGRFDDALGAAMEAIRVAPRWAKGHARAGAALFYLRRFDEAHHAYANALRLKPNYEAARMGAAEARAAAAEAKLASAISGGAGADTTAKEVAASDSSADGRLQAPSKRLAQRPRKPRRAPTVLSAADTRSRARDGMDPIGDGAAGGATADTGGAISEAWLRDTLGTAAPTVPNKGGAAAGIIGLAPGDEMDDEEAASLPFAHALLLAAGVDGAADAWVRQRPADACIDADADGDSRSDADRVDGAPARAADDVAYSDGEIVAAADVASPATPPSVGSVDGVDAASDRLQSLPANSSSTARREVNAVTDLAADTQAPMQAAPCTPAVAASATGALSEGNVARLCADLAHLAEAVAQSPARASAACRRAINADARAEEAETRAVAAEARAAEAQLAAGDVNASLAAARAEAAVLRSKTGSLQSEAAALALDVRRLAAEREAVEREIGERRARSAEASTACAALHASRQRLEQRVVDAETATAAAERKAASARESTAVAEAARVAAMAALRDGAAQLQVLDGRVQATERRLADAAALLGAALGERARAAAVTARRAADRIAEADAAIAACVASTCQPSPHDQRHGGMASRRLGPKPHPKTPQDDESDEKITCPLGICPAGELCVHENVSRVSEQCHTEVEVAEAAKVAEPVTVPTPQTSVSVENMRDIIGDEDASVEALRYFGEQMRHLGELSDDDGDNSDSARCESGESGDDSGASVSDGVELTDADLLAELERERAEAQSAAAVRDAARSAAVKAPRRRRPPVRNGGSVSGKKAAASALDLGSVMELADSKARRRRDPAGVLRAACLNAQCPVSCAQYEPNRSGRGPPTACVQVRHCVKLETSGLTVLDHDKYA